MQLRLRISRLGGKELDGCPEAPPPLTRLPAALLSPAAVQQLASCQVRGVRQVWGRCGAGTPVP